MLFANKKEENKNWVSSYAKGNRDRQPVKTEVVDYYDTQKMEWQTFEIHARG